MPTVCKGCAREFTLGGYGNHLAQTKNSACKKLYDEQMSYLPRKNVRVGASEDGSNPMGSAGPEGSTQSDGDFFGDYDDYDENEFLGDFGDGVGKMGLDSTDEEREEDEAAQIDLERGWEPPRPNTAHVTLDDDLQDHTEQTHSHDIREEAEGRFYVDPVVVSYPGDRAGEIVQGNKTGFEAYEGFLDGQERENVYAPFNSRIDWLFGKWAKLRGPGSTAITELLNIEGVSANSLWTGPFVLTLAIGTRSTWTFI